MQRKTLLSACIALALSGQGWAADITEIETTTGEKKNTNVTCPADPGKLSPEELKRLPSECSPVVEQNLMPWLATGAATALITALAIVELNDDDDHHHRNNSPLPPTPPDDNSDDTPVPPTPGGDEIIPDDGSDDTPTPPKPISFNNDVILDKTAKTLTIRDSVFTYTENADGTISLQDSNGRKATINIWQIDEANNTVALDGVSADGATKWQYNHNGELVITGDNATVNNNGKTIVDGKDSTGTEIAGNNGKVIQDGILDVSGGGHGIDITGDSATVDNKGGMTVTDPDSIGILIDGDKAIVNNDGDNAISNGGTGTQVNGDEATVNNNGKTTVDGQGSTGTEIAGNNAVVNQDGTLDVSGGAHGIDITGNGAIANTTGAITVADTDSVGIQVDGNDVTVSNDGDSTITNGGTGTQVNGNDAQVNNTGNTTVDGKNSTGTEITGNNGTVNLDGSLIVTGGAYGVEIVGDSATLNNEGDISVADEGSIGVLINGEKATVSNTGDVNVSNNATGFDITTNEGNISLAGSMQVGDFSTGMDLNGNNNSVTLAAKDLNVTGQKATGVNISGDANTVKITGNVVVDKDQTADNAADYFYDPSVGINVNGSDNNITLDGKLTVVADSELTTNSYTQFDGSQENITGLSIAGDGNTFRLNGGIQLVGEANKLTDGSTIASERKGSGKVPLVSVDGKSSVHLNGDSTISGDVLLGNTQIIDLRNGAMLDVGADATINMQVDTYERYAMSADHLIDASSGSQLVNNGDINLRSIGFAAITGEDSFGSNTGNLTLSQYLDGLFANGGYGYLATKGASVVNTGTITTKVAEQESVINLGASLGFNDLVFYNAANSMTGLSAKTHGYVLNENGGKIEMFGRGNVGMLAIDESTAENAGQITLDALWVDVNDTTTLRDNIGNDARGYSVGMGVGTDAGSGPRKNATAVNQQSGVITVYNAGIGMAAYGAGNTVINQGTINLEKNGNYDSSLGVNSLIGMAAYNSGTAINDQTGVININADNGQAFYSTGNGVILNYGTICVNTNCLTGNDYNDTDSYTSILYTGGDVITAQSETQKSEPKKPTISDKKDGNVVNSGALSGADIAISSGKLVNTSTGTINNAIIINGGALSNEGSVAKVTQNAGTFNNTGSVNSRMTQTGGTFNNQQGGTVKNGSRLANSAIANNMGIWSLGDTSSGGNASMLEINNNAVFKNSGDFILDNSKNAVHLNQSGTFYNTGKMLLSNSSHNGVLNFWGGNGRFINGGIADVTAKSLAVSASDAGSSNAFFWNQSNGVVNFDKDSGVAVKFTHSNYVAQNDGTMNISGNNAIAMEGDKNARLVNNGTINLGTSGTTDTGMIGMQLDSGTTADAVIENNGAINIYANNSFAFSMLGSVGHLVNNGTVTIADGVTGSGLIKQGDSVNIEGVNGNNGNNSEVHYADYTLPDVPGSSVSVAASTPSSDGSQNKLNGYVVGTSSDGSAGKLKVNNASLKGVSVNTGFTAGTSSTSVTFDNVVQGSNLTDAETITSTSVVWNAQGTS